MESGARYLHLARDDNNNAFCVGFRTPVSNNKGIPHILEHTILCGSEKYPIREPFFNMLRRSMQTYMNAWTGLGRLHLFASLAPPCCLRLFFFCLDSPPVCVLPPHNWWVLGCCRSCPHSTNPDVSLRASSFSSELLFPPPLQAWTTPCFPSLRRTLLTLRT